MTYKILLENFKLIYSLMEIIVFKVSLKKISRILINLE